MFHAKRILIALVGCTAFLMSSPPAQARNILEAIFGPPAQVEKQKRYSRRAARPKLSRRAAIVKRIEAPVAQKNAAAAARPNSPRSIRRSAAARHSSPRSVRLDRQPSQRRVVHHASMSARTLTDAELVARILTDPTLRAGDVVEFPSGPRVYTGKGRFSSHRISDFAETGEAVYAGAADQGAGFPRPSISPSDVAEVGSVPLPE
jgi:hypothetical protein